LNEFAQTVKSSLQAPFVQLWTAGAGETKLVKKIAVCGGAGGSLISQATGQADVLVTGDINYHAMLDSRIPLVNAGHFYTEYPALTKLQDYLKDRQIVAEVFPMSGHEVRHNILL
jgi:putative NIF3 family GTP cyclohydrolase 1 type 2